LFYVHLGVGDSEEDLLQLFQAKCPNLIVHTLCLQFSQLGKLARKSCPVPGEIIRQGDEDILVVCKFMRARYIAIAVVVWSFMEEKDADSDYDELAFILSNYGITTERGARKCSEECGCQGPRHLTEQ
jgi:hypothetical protein